MSKPQHPYPEHIRDKVALGLFAADCEDNPELDPNEEPHPGYYEYADTALQALWEASRVPDLDSIDELPEHAIVLDKDGFCAIGREHAITDITNHDFPAHIIYWGDSDE